MKEEIIKSMEEVFIEGWWNCFNAFAIEFFLKSHNSDYLEKVLEGAGVEIEEIKKVVNSDVISDSLKQWLIEFLDKKSK